MNVRVEVLGPLRLVVDGRVVDVPGPKRRAVLALLALAEGRVVTAEDLVDALWPEGVPDSGRQALHTHVSRLRGHLGPAAALLETRNDGYLLRLPDDALDLARARTLLATARTRAQHDAADAYALLREAQALWRGPLLADLRDVAPIAAAVAGCAQLHRDVADLLVATAVDAGRAEEVVGLAAASVAAEPLREPAVLLWMRALAATGQASEAMRAGRDFRHRLAEETGLDPSPALGEVERAVAGGGAAARPAVTGRASARLVGRESEVAALHRLLASERLITLVGPGGVGKTRVALEVTRRTDATTALLLAPVVDPEAIPYALAAALDLNVAQGDVLAACAAVLAARPGLLLVDNCEHLLAGVRDVVELLLASCPDLIVLATSRERLGLPAEYAFRLAPLPLPEPDQDPRPVPSVALFLDRAGRVRPDVPQTAESLRVVADIVRRLDGMPLAIELAAGRLSTFSVTALRDRLDRSLDLLGSARPSADARHRTLRATVEWSYDLLAEDEQRLFRQLAVFVGGVDLETVERVAADLGLPGDPGSVLARLVDASMVEADFGTDTRYRMLDTLRAFGLDRLARNGELETATERLVRWGVETVGWLEAALNTELEPEADAVLRRELPNLRAAWRLARDRGSLDAAVAMVVGLFDALTYRDLVELREWATELAGDPALATHPRRAAVLGTAAEAAYQGGDYARAERLARAGLELAGKDWHCLMALSVAELARGAHADVVEHSLAAAAVAGPPRENLGIAALAMAYTGDLERARSLNDSGLAGAVSPSMLSWGAYVAGEIEKYAGRDDLAEQHYLRAIEQARAAGATFLAGIATVGLLAVQAKPDGYREVVDYFERTGNWTHLWTALRNLADLLRVLGDHEPAALIHAAADQAQDAPAVAHASGSGQPASPRMLRDRAEVLDVARRAIARHVS